MGKFRPFDYLTESEKREVSRIEALSKATSSLHNFREFDKIINEYLQLARLRKELEDLEHELNKLEKKENEDEDNNSELLATCP